MIKCKSDPWTEGSVPISEYRTPVGTGSTTYKCGQP